MKKCFDHEQIIQLYSHEGTHSADGNQVGEVDPDEMVDENEESNCHVDEDESVVQLAVEPHELIWVPGPSLLDHAVLWAVINESLGA